MKIFIINILKFFSIIFILIIIVVASYYTIINREEFWKLPNNEKLIVFGSSRSTCAFSDELIPDFVNISSAGESYFYTQFKLKKIITSNQQLNTIFIEFDERDILKKHESWIWSEKYLRKRLATYLPIMDFQEFGVILKNNSKAVLNIPPKNFLKEALYSYYNLIFENNCFKSKSKRYGGAAYLERSLNDSLVEIEKSYREKNKLLNCKIDEINIHYLIKILEFCKQNKVRVCFIKTPVHKMCYSKNEKEAYNEILNTNFSNIMFLNFEYFPLEDKDFSDFEHLNYIGAEKFSKWFAQILDKQILDRENRQEFINNEFLKMKSVNQ